MDEKIRRYQEINIAINKLNTKLSNAKNDEERMMILSQLQQIKFDQQRIERSIIPKKIDIQEIFQKMLDLAFSNILLHIIIHSDMIQNVVNECDVKNIHKVQDVPKRWVSIAEFVFMAIYEDPILSYDYEWIMCPNKNNQQVPFDAICSDPALVKKAIMMAETKPVREVIEMYKLYQSKIKIQEALPNHDQDKDQETPYHDQDKDQETPWINREKNELEQIEVMEVM